MNRSATATFGISLFRFRIVPISDSAKCLNKLFLEFLRTFDLLSLDHGHGFVFLIVSLCDPKSLTWPKVATSVDQSVLSRDGSLKREKE